MSQPSSLLLVDPDSRSLETLTFGFEREGCKVAGTPDPRRATQLARTISPDLAVVSLRAPERAGLDLITGLREGDNRGLPVVVLGSAALKSDAIAAGASDFLPLPGFVRDVISVSRLSAVIGQAHKAARVGVADDADEGTEISVRLSDYFGLFYLLRAMAASGRSGVLTLTRGSRRAEIRVHEGTVVSANVASLQGLPALHHVLLWEEAALAIRLRAVPSRNHLHLTTQEILDECERFMRDFAHAARDLGAPRTLYVPAPDPNTATPGLQPSQVTPLLRLFDGHRVLADVIEASPFRIFDTVRMIRRLRDSGALVVRPDELIHDRGRASSPPPAGYNGPPSMLAQWAMVPDDRGVVGNDYPAVRRTSAVAETRGAAPIPLVNKKSVAVAGEISARPRLTPAAGAEPSYSSNVHVRRDGSALLGAAPMVAPAPAPVTAHRLAPPVRSSRTTSGQISTLDRLPPAADQPPRPRRKSSGPRMTTDTAFDAIESDFFAREADLYRREAVETFDDLDRSGAHKPVPDPDK